MINDLQQLIENENPANMTNPAQDDNLRTGKLRITSYLDVDLH